MTDHIANAIRLAVRNTNHAPSDAQKSAGNYEKGKFPWHGLTIAIENPKGSERSGTDKGGKRWAVKMPSIYGYVLGTEGKDKDHVDVYVGDDHSARTVFVIDQVDASTGRFDEHKAFLNFPDKDAALKTYERAFSDGRAKDRIGAINEMTIDQFKRWLQSGDTKKPLGPAAKGYAAGGTVKESTGASGSWGDDDPQQSAIAAALAYLRSLPSRAMTSFGAEGERLRRLGDAGLKEQVRDMPGIGRGVNAYDEAREGNYGSAAGEAALGALDATPALRSLKVPGYAAMSAWKTAADLYPKLLAERSAQELAALTTPRMKAGTAAAAKREQAADWAARRAIKEPVPPEGYLPSQAERMATVANRTWPGNVGAGVLTATAPATGVMLDDVKGLADPLYGLRKEAAAEPGRVDRKAPFREDAGPEVAHYQKQRDEAARARNINIGLAGAEGVGGVGATYGAIKTVPWAARNASMGLMGLGADAMGIHPLLGLGVMGAGLVPFAVPAALGYSSWKAAHAIPDNIEYAHKAHDRAKLIDKVMDNYRQQPSQMTVGPGDYAAGGPVHSLDAPTSDPTGSWFDNLPRAKQADEFDAVMFDAPPSPWAPWRDGTSYTPRTPSISPDDFMASIIDSQEAVRTRNAYAAGGKAMPLDKSGTKASVGRNIATEMKAGRPKAQSIAIALDTARRYAKRASGGRVGMWSGGDPDSIAPELTRDILPPKREPATDGFAGTLNRMFPSGPSRQERAMAEANRVMDQPTGEFATEAGIGAAAPYVLGPVVSRVPKRYVAAGAAGLLGSLIGGDKGSAEPPNGKSAPTTGLSPREVRNAEIKALEAQIERQQESLTKQLGAVGAQKFRGVGEEAGMARQKAMEEAAKPYNENIAAIRARMGELRGANDDEDKAMVGVERRADQARRDVLSEGNQPFNKTPVGHEWNKAGPLAPAAVGAGTAFLERALHGPKAGWKLPIALGTGAGALSANIPLAWDAFFQPTVNPNKTAMQTYGQELKIGQHPRAQEFLDYANSLETPNPVSKLAYDRFTDLPDAGKRMLFGAGEGGVGAATGFAGAVGLERAAKAGSNAIKGVYNHFAGSPPAGSTPPSPRGPLGGGGGQPGPLGTVVEAPIPLTAMPESRMLPSPNQSRLADRLPEYREAVGSMNVDREAVDRALALTKRQSPVPAASSSSPALSAPDPSKTIIVDAHGARYPGGHPEGLGGKFAIPDTDAKIMTRAQWNKSQRAADKAAKSKDNGKSLTKSEGNEPRTAKKELVPGADKPERMPDEDWLKGRKIGGVVSRALDIARSYARGGAVRVGAMPGATGGRDDKLPVSVPAGSYILPADAVSGWPGAGNNTAAGFKLIEAQFGKSQRPAHAQGGAADILISDGEYILGPDQVAKIGGGSLEKGHAMLDAMVHKVRDAHVKALSSLPSPAR